MRRKRFKKKLSTRLLAFALSLTMVGGSFMSNRLMVRANDDAVTGETTESSVESADQAGDSADVTGAENTAQPTGEQVVPGESAGDSAQSINGQTTPAEENVQPTDGSAQAAGNEAAPQQSAQPATGDPAGEDDTAGGESGIAPVNDPATEPVNVFKMKLTARDNTTLAPIPGAYFEIREAYDQKDANNKWVVKPDVKETKVNPGEYTFPEKVYKTYVVTLVSGGAYEASDATVYVTFKNAGQVDARSLEGSTVTGDPAKNTTVKLPTGDENEIFFNVPVKAAVTPSQPATGNDDLFTFNLSATDKKSRRLFRQLSLSSRVTVGKKKYLPEALLSLLNRETEHIRFALIIRTLLTRVTQASQHSY